MRKVVAHVPAAPLDLLDDVERGVGDELVLVPLLFAEARDAVAAGTWRCRIRG